MGVIKGSTFPDAVPRSIEDVLENIENEEVDQPDNQVAHRPRKIKHKAKAQLVGGSHVMAATSGKKKKRVENTNFLLSLCESDDIYDITIQDFLAPTVSVFTEFYIHRNQIEIWHEFVNCAIDNEDLFQKNMLPAVSGNEANKAVYDMRNDHPAYNEVEHRHKINANIRLMFKKKHVPLGKLMYLEQELVTFFMNHPESIFHIQIPNSYDRFICHVLSEYMGLSSLSYDKCGTRWTRVKNKKQHFFLPSILLSSYVENRLNNKKIT